MKKIKGKRRHRSKAVKIKLRKREIQFLEEFVKTGEKKARSLTRANILLLAHQKIKDTKISKMLNITGKTIWQIKKNYLNVGLPGALEEKPRSGQPKKYNEKHEAEIIALACTAPPEGSKAWSIRLLVEELKKKKSFGSINREVVRLILKKTFSNRGKKRCGAYQK